jgi:putative methionine-R-sulfoxide reductase with GAF domain
MNKWLIDAPDPIDVEAFSNRLMGILLALVGATKGVPVGPQTSTAPDLAPVVGPPEVEPGIMSPDQPQDRLAKLFGDLAVELQGQTSAPDTLRSIVDAAAQIVPGARWVGISLVEGKKVTPQVPTSRPVEELDELQSELSDGPCVTALRQHHTVQIDDMRTETRWPSFARAAHQRGMLSLLAFQLFIRSESLGALNLYSDQPFAFSEDSVIIGEVLAQHAAVAMVGASEVTQLRNALATRDLIGQAKGILMERNKRTDVQAFNLLTRASQKANMKLVDVARWLIAESAPRD